MKFEEEWNAIMKDNLYCVWQLDELNMRPNLTMELDSAIVAIFELLQKLRYDRFYNPTEIARIYLMIREDVMVINHVLMILDNKITHEVYEIILNIFEELTLLGEDFEMYELSSNIIKIRDYWFNTYNIKITNASAK